MKNKLKEIMNYIKENRDTLTKKELNDILDKYELTNEEKFELVDIFEGRETYDNYYNSYHEDDIFKDYCLQIAKYELLSFDEIKDLCIKIKEGSKEAKDKLIKHNLKLVVSIAKRYKNYGLDIMDLIEEGNIGLMKAIDLYDYTLGIKFSTYAFFWIRQSITRSLDYKSKALRLPPYLKQQINKLNMYESILTNELGRAPTNKELAEYFNNQDTQSFIKPEKIDELKQLDNAVLSLNAPISDIESDDISLIDIVSDQDENNISSQIETKILFEKINYLLGDDNNILKDQEKEVLKFRFGFNGTPLTLEEIAKIYNVTKERIRQIEGKALRKMRKSKKMKKVFEGYDL